SNECISILIATDNHLGYMENDPIRGQDSLNTFREILQIAKQNDVYLILNTSLFSKDGNLCALDVLAVSGLVNYFGKANVVENIIVKPILLRKGETVLALYGLGNVRDQRLHRMFTDDAVKINLPPNKISSESFNLMVLHQNRHVAKLNIIGDQFELKKIRLRTVRPFVIGELSLKDVEGLDPTKTSAVNAYLITKVEELIQDAKNQWLEMNDYDYDLDEEMFPLPLIRLKVEYSGGFTVLNNRQFGQKFVNLVANNHEILFFYRKRAFAVDEFDMPENLSHNYVTDLVTENMKSLSILPENALNEATTLFVDKDDPHAIEGNEASADTYQQEDGIDSDNQIGTSSRAKTTSRGRATKTTRGTGTRGRGRGKTTTSSRKNVVDDEGFVDDIDIDDKSDRTERARGRDDLDIDDKSDRTERARGRGRGRTTTSSRKNVVDDEGFLDDINNDDRSNHTERTRGRG
ncbi:7967_t:CDS:10, partial [Racocetra fulgida]